MALTRDVVTLIVLGIAATCDIRLRRIPNWLTLPSMVVGVGIHLASGGVAGLVNSIKGLAVGTAVLLIPFLAGGMGGGDVKLMGAVGALQGVSLVVHSVLYAAVVGGLLCCVAHAVAGRLLLTLKQVALWALSWLALSASVFLPALINRAPYKPQSLQGGNVRIPYAVAIALGTALAVLTRAHPLW